MWRIRPILSVQLIILLVVAFVCTACTNVQENSSGTPHSELGQSAPSVANTQKTTEEQPSATAMYEADYTGEYGEPGPDPSSIMTGARYAMTLGFHKDIKNTVPLSQDLHILKVQRSNLDSQKMLTAFYQENLDKLTIELHNGVNTTSKRSADEHYLYSIAPDQGYFYMSKPSTIPFEYYGAAGDDPRLPRPSETPGKYTPFEAVDTAKEYLSSVLGIDTTKLVVDSIIPESYDKPRSRSYQITFLYQYNGIPLKPGYSAPGNMRVVIWLSDDGVSQVEGVSLNISEKELVNPDTLIEREKLLTLHQNDGSEYWPNPTLAYEIRQQSGSDDLGVPAWILKDDSDSYLTIRAYDGFSGKQLNTGGYGG